MASQYPPSLRFRLPACILFLEAAFLLIFYFFFTYDRQYQHLQRDPALYAAFQDVNVLVILGFSFLLAFLKRFGFSSTGFSLCLAALGVQWAMIVNGFLFHFSCGAVEISLQSILEALMTVTMMLISVGAVLGKANLMQLIWMAVVELTVFGLNRWIAVAIMKIANHVSLMHVHLFGAYFGLMVSWKLYHSSLSSRVEKEGSKPTSDTFAMLGTLFLWMFWPSFNSVLITEAEKKWLAVCNTYLAIAASSIAAFSVSAATSRHGKLTMAHIQNASLAGGVALGFSASMIHHPWLAMTLGLAAGAVSALGSGFLKKCLDPAIGLHDTRGVHSMFGLPSLLGGIAHVILIVVDSWEDLSVLGYSALMEAGALCLSMALGLIGGFITGFFLTFKFWKAPPVTKYFDDQAYWEFPNLAVGY
ncbi:blood group Rh(CE) polypeptide isoform X2 [Anolis carolinensis]|uniref:blood group Rh(CE) polypeptide isoform X2 n=1 Tax=Anolis carolinensis TaxID=28377 RepID=UPI0007DB73E1|nr:PREDICTED: blood group Rh(CE) polypeptide isoform X1 [Anolis carolinensis]|eukprot:XP_003228750.3 PREDICTED: blood group Rh(CE) polypeptide isoform X1 [Anolis carolinensis]